MGSITRVQPRKICYSGRCCGATGTDSRLFTFASGRSVCTILIVHRLKCQSDRRDVDRTSCRGLEPIIAIVFVPLLQIFLHVREASSPFRISSSPRHVQDQIGFCRNILPEKLDSVATISILCGRVTEGGNLRLVLQDQKIRFVIKQRVQVVIGIF